jgi:hypothetical protein
VRLTDDHVGKLEKVVSRDIPKELVTKIEDVINAYREEAVLQAAAPNARDVLDELETLKAQLHKVWKAVLRLNARKTPAVCEAADLFDGSVSLRRSKDPEIESLSEFSRRLGSMAEVTKGRIGDLTKAYRGQRGAVADQALDNFISRLVPIAAALGLRVTANYSQAAGRRTGHFVALVKAAATIARDGKRTTGIDERCARVLKKVRGEAKPPAAKLPSH